jgi:hypothetical protein
MTGISLHVQWPLTSQSHGGFLKENNWMRIAFRSRRKAIFVTFLEVEEFDGAEPRTLSVPSSH